MAAVAEWPQGGRRVVAMVATVVGMGMRMAMVAVMVAATVVGQVGRCEGRESEGVHGHISADLESTLTLGTGTVAQATDSDATKQLLVRKP